MRPLRLLFWLKWKMMFRGYRRRRSSFVSSLLLILVFFPISVVLAVFAFFGFQSLSPENSGHLLRAILSGVYLFWLMAPLLGYSLNDTYDVTRLFVYPLSLRQILTGAVFASLLDISTLFWAPMLVAISIQFPHGIASLVLIVCALLLFLAHTLTLSQGIILATEGILRSRRFRDAATTLIPVLWLLYYFGNQTLLGRFGAIHWEKVVHTRFWELVGYLPPGWAERAINAASRGEWGAALGYLMGLTAFTVGSIYAAAALLTRVYAGDRVGLRAAGVKKEPEVSVSVSFGQQAGAVERPSLLRFLPPVVLAVAEKEARYYKRDPYFRIVVMNLVYLMAVACFSVIGIRREPLTPTATLGIIWGATALLLLSEMQVVGNLFGTDGTAASLLFLFPCSRRHILMGKNLTVFGALSLVNFVFLAALTFIAKAADQLGLLLVWMEMALVILLALGNILSIYFPYRSVAKGWRMRQSGSRGFAYTLMYMGALVAAGVLLLPVLAGLVLPGYLQESGWLALTLPCTVAYTIGLYAVSLYRAEGLLSSREREVVAKLGLEE